MQARYAHKGGCFARAKKSGNQGQRQQPLSPDSTGNIHVLSGLLAMVHDYWRDVIDISWRFHLQLPHVNVKLDLSSNVRLACWFV